MDICYPLTSKEIGAIKELNWLVTGAAGFIGSHLVETLMSLGSNVVGVDDFSSGKEENLPKGSNIIKGAYFNPSVCEEVKIQLNKIGASNTIICLHHAATSSIPACTASPYLALHNNLTGVFDLASFLCTNFKNVVFIFASTSAVYGETNCRISEANEPKPISIYGASKLACEIILQQLDLTLVNFRYFNIFGSRQNKDSSYAGVISKWKDNISTTGEVDVYGNGNQTRDFVHVSNVVYANILGALHGINNLGSKSTFNVASGSSINLMTLLDALKEQLNLKCEVNFLPPRSGDIVYSEADVSKIQDQLGFRIITPFEKGLLELCQNG